VTDQAAPGGGRRDGARSLHRQRVALAGHGLLATAISEWLSADPRIQQVRAGNVSGTWDLPDLAGLAADADSSPDSQILITSSDAWDCRGLEHIQALCAAHRITWVPVRTELGRVVIGPLHVPGETGCVHCAGLRRSVADQHSAARDSLRQKYPRLAEQPSPWLTAAAAQTVAALTADEVTGLGPRSGRTRRALLYVALDTLAVSTHRFLPDPLCRACGALPGDNPEAARITLRPRPKPAPGEYRVRPLGDVGADGLRATYVDREAGLIQHVQTLAGGGLAVAVAALRTRHQARAELGWGRTSHYRGSEMVAVLEALERYGGMTPGGRRTTVRASFAEVRGSALDPRTLGLYPPERHGRPGFGFEPFDTDRVCSWVWGYSLGRQEPILVPQGYAYYSTHLTDPDDPLFAFETSNGCALGSCLEEAILYGLLELAERDAFLMTWYTRLPAARIRLSSARDRSIPLLAQAIEAETGYQVLAFDTTMEYGIPSVWAMAVRSPGAQQPALACSAGAHLDPELAASRALWELGPILSDLIKRYPEVAPRGRAMAGDPSLVVTMEDHSVLYADSEAAARLDFLTAGGPSRGFADIRRRHAIADAFHHADLTDDLTEMLRRLRRHGLDIIVVNQTTPEHLAGGFCCVKAIVPGLLPMTFGHDNRRTHGLPRLLEVPMLLGYRDRALLPHEINPHPHPFP
jgi:ribosomal protein S12 methylthiotransferase accessory factor